MIATYSWRYSESFRNMFFSDLCDYIFSWLSIEILLESHILSYNYSLYRGNTWDQSKSNWKWTENKHLEEMEHIESRPIWWWWRKRAFKTDTNKQTLTCETSALVSCVALSWNTSRNSLGLDVTQNSLADSTNCWISCKLSSACSGDIEHFSMRCDANSSMPRAHQLFACKSKNQAINPLSRYFQHAIAYLSAIFYGKTLSSQHFSVF